MKPGKKTTESFANKTGIENTLNHFNNLIMKPLHINSRQSQSIIVFCLFVFVYVTGSFNQLDAQIKSAEIAGRFALNYFNSAGE